MNLILRTFSAIILLPIVIYLIHLGGWPFKILIGVVLSLCLYEFTMMTTKFAETRILTMSTAVAILSLVIIHTQSLAAAPIILSLACFVVGALFVFKTNLSKEHFAQACILLFGLFYCVGGLGSLYLLDATFIFLALIVTFSSDTFAYFAGRIFGKHKLHEAVSPSKTWEGAIAGALGCIAIPFAFQNLLSISTSDILWVAIPSAVFAPVGDLIESRLKRLFDIKDSGQLLPGHGGFLDRIDALLIVAPWVLTYAFLIRPLC